MTFWVYEHRAAEKNAVVHIGSCGHCNDGYGCQRNRRGEENGRWHGPFSTSAAATKAAHATGCPTRQHGCTKVMRVRPAARA